MEKFNSKKGVLIILGFIFVMLLEVASALIFGIFKLWQPFAIATLLICFFVVPQFFGTKYYLDEDDLEINCGWMIMRKSIKYKDIVAAVRKNDVSIAPALSCDRVEITYNQEGSTMVTYLSPKEIDKFMQIITDKIMSAHGEKPKKERRNEKLEKDRSKLATLLKDERIQKAEKKAQNTTKSIVSIPTIKKLIEQAPEAKPTTTKTTSKKNTTKKLPATKTTKPTKKIVATSSSKKEEKVVPVKKSASVPKKTTAKKTTSKAIKKTTAKKTTSKASPKKPSKK